MASVPGEHSMDRPARRSMLRPTSGGWPRWRRRWPSPRPRTVDVPSLRACPVAARCRPWRSLLGLQLVGSPARRALRSRVLPCTSVQVDARFGFLDPAGGLSATPPRRGPRGTTTTPVCIGHHDVARGHAHGADGHGVHWTSARGPCPCVRSGRANMGKAVAQRLALMPWHTPSITVAAMPRAGPRTGS